jgi:hypothetical protein
MTRATDFITGGAGALALTLAASFGWYTGDQVMGHVMSVHSVILVAIGLALLLASYSIRRAAKRIAALENEIVSMRRRNG